MQIEKGRILENKMVFVAFFNGVKTMRMVAKELQVDRANICRYVASWRKSGSIYFVRKACCKDSKKSGVGFYTTNKMVYESEILKDQL